MKKQNRASITAHIVQRPFYVLVVLTGTFLAFFHPQARANLSNRTLTFAERVSYQRAIEEVYWRHRLWPNENLDPKPSLDAVMCQGRLEKKVNKLSAIPRTSWRMAGDGRLALSSYRLRWIGWQSTPDSPRCCANSLKRSEVIHLLLQSV